MNRLYLAAPLALSFPAMAQDVAFTTDNINVTQLPAIPVSKLVTSTVTVNGQNCTLGGSCTIAGTGGATTPATSLLLKGAGSANTTAPATASDIVSGLGSSATITVNSQTCTLGGTCTIPGTGGASTPATTNVYKGNNAANGVVAATPGTDYVKPNGDGSISTAGGTANGAVGFPVGSGGDQLPSALTGFGQYSWLGAHPYFVPPTGSAIQLDFNAPNSALPGFAVFPLNSGTCTTALTGMGASDAALCNDAGVLKLRLGSGTLSALCTYDGTTAAHCPPSGGGGGGTTWTYLRTAFSGSTQSFSNAFSAVNMGASSVDTATAWNGTDTYTVPTSGEYAITAYIHLQDNTGATSLSVGLGANTSAAAGADFAWDIAPGAPSASPNIARKVLTYVGKNHYAAGDAVKIIEYGAVGVTGAGLTIQLLHAD